jgi:hypothetical protein
MTNYIKSSEIKNINNKNYLQIFLNKEYSFKANDNNVDKSYVEILLEEPNRSDLSNLKTISTILNDYQKKIEEESLRNFMKMNEDEKAKLMEAIEKTKNKPTEEKPLNAEERLESIKNSIKELFNYNNAQTNYFDNLDSIFLFLKRKVFREFNNEVLQTSFDLVITNNDNLPSIGSKVYLQEDLIIEYVSFFLKHFPSRSLHDILKTAI